MSSCIHRVRSMSSDPISSRGSSVESSMRRHVGERRARWGVWCKRVLILSGIHLLLSLCVGGVAAASIPAPSEPSHTVMEICVWSLALVVWLATRVFEGITVTSWIFYVVLVINAVIYGIAYACTWGLLDMWRDGSRHGQGYRCGRCGYDLRAATDDLKPRRCPECGAAS